MKIETIEQSRWPVCGHCGCRIGCCPYDECLYVTLDDVRTRYYGPQPPIPTHGVVAWTLAAAAFLFVVYHYFVA